MTHARPLDGVRVAEFGHVAAGPFASLLLADLGADVVKVESPAGDQMRAWPPIAEADGERFSHNFAAVNRNKRSVVADLKDPDDLARVRELCLAADVVVENYRPGVLARLGLGYDALAAEHRGLVFASVSGFGQTGSYAGLGAYDVVIQAMSGLMSVTGTEEGELVKAGVPVADFTSGLYAALGVVAWLPRVRATGRSVHLDVPMLDCLLATSALQTSEYWGSGVEPAPIGTRHPRNAPYQVFVASDATFVLAAGNDRLWRGVCGVVGRPDLAEDPRFSSQGDRVTNQLELEKLLTEAFAERPATEWVELLRAAGVPAGPVNTFGDILADPTVRESGLVQPYDVPVAGLSWTTVFPVRATDVEPRMDRPAPRLGEQTDEVLAEWSSPVTAIRLALDRPERANALDPATVERLHDALDTDAEVLVIEARGPVFCGGLDLSTLDDESDADLLLRLVRIQLLLERLAASPALTVAVVQGPAVGAGADLALATDVRLALPGASLTFPGAGFGAVLGTGRLAALTSPSYATEAAATGRRITETEAYELGLLRLVPTLHDAETAVDRLAARTSGLPPGTPGRLRAAGAPPAGQDPLGHLVRSLADRPGLRDRVRSYRDRPIPIHEGAR